MFIVARTAKYQGVNARHTHHKETPEFFATFAIIEVHRADT